MSDVVDPNLDIYKLINAGIRPGEGRDGRFSFLGGYDCNRDVRCDHGWPAVSRMDDTVWGCPGHVLNEKPGLQDDGIACGFFMRASQKRYLRLNMRSDHEFDWGATSPDNELLLQRKLYRCGWSANDNSADILQSIQDASNAATSVDPPFLAPSGADAAAATHVDPARRTPSPGPSTAKPVQPRITPTLPPHKRVKSPVTPKRPSSGQRTSPLSSNKRSPRQAILKAIRSQRGQRSSSSGQAVAGPSNRRLPATNVSQGSRQGSGSSSTSTRGDAALAPSDDEDEEMEKGGHQ